MRSPTLTPWTELLSKRWSVHELRGVRASACPMLAHGELVADVELVEIPEPPLSTATAAPVPAELRPAS